MSVCEFCRREVGDVTTHHLIPRTRHKKNKKNFTRDDFKGRPVDLCRACHKQVHQLTNKEAKQYF